MQVDTGSSDLAIYSSQCNNTPAGAATYNPWNSDNTASPVPCNTTAVTCGGCTASECEHVVSLMINCLFARIAMAWNGTLDRL